MRDAFELHPERLATTDEHGRRQFIYPADVHGKWKTRRSRVQAALILFFLALPWIHVNGRQFFLLDIARRKFEIFGLSLRAHDAPALVLVLATFAFGLFLATALLGRVWCGWACPQTVFIDGVFRWIERKTEGAAMSRRLLAQSPWTLRKFRIKAVKWLLYTLAGAVITHSFLAYFVGSRELLGMISSDPRENWTSFLFILVATGLVLFNFAWFREQFCTIVCPYGRFQSAYMDAHTTVVGYDAKRGEPRRTREAPKETPLGDCVNCYRCVQVCPTGIDIRRGNQLECIACTACIDACDEVMTKIKKPTGLIRYTSENELAGQPPSRLRPRVVILAVLFALSFSGLMGFALLREPLDMHWLRAKGAPYEIIRGDGRAEIVVNRFQIEVSNQGDVARDLSVSSAGAGNPEGADLVMALNPARIEPGTLQRLDVFVRMPKSAFKNGTARFLVEIRDSVEGDRRSKELTLVGPIF